MNVGFRFYKWDVVQRLKTWGNSLAMIREIKTTRISSASSSITACVERCTLIIHLIRIYVRYRTYVCCIGHKVLPRVAGRSPPRRGKREAFRGLKVLY